MDGSEAVALSVVPEGTSAPEPPAEMVCTVRGNPGFNEGCTYELTLAEGWVFMDEGTGEDKPESIRTATFSIRME